MYCNTNTESITCYVFIVLQVRGVEIGIVLLVLVVWVAAIALFFNRWGKIRMLLPYQPDYKQEQLKVPGTAACAAAVAATSTCTHHSGEHVCPQVGGSMNYVNRRCGKRDLMF